MINTKSDFDDKTTTSKLSQSKKSPAKMKITFKSKQESFNQTSSSNVLKSLFKGNESLNQRRAKNSIKIKQQKLTPSQIENETGVQINLKRCVESDGFNRIPNFGFPMVHFDQQESYYGQNKNRIDQSEKMTLSKMILGGINQQKQSQSEVKKKNVDFQSDLPFQPVLQKKRQQDRAMDHVLKCFTFGKKVRRQLDEEVAQVSRVDILKRRFQRLSLVRSYFAINKKGNLRKFQNPLNEEGKEEVGKRKDIYDELQYAQESDIEDIKDEYKDRKEKKQKDKVRKGSRLDLAILTKLSQNSQSSFDEQESDTDTFKDLKSQCSRSDYSSPRQRMEKEHLAYDRVMPFDFVTQRKVKKFFKGEIVPIDQLLQDKDLMLQNIKNEEEYEDEFEQIREVPELNLRLKAMLKIIPKNSKIKKPKKLTIKGEFSSSSEEDDKFDDFQYGQIVQNTQNRDNNNELVSLFFQRSFGKTQRHKRETLSRIARFKQSILPTQREILNNRQFVIVDKKSLHNQKKKTNIIGTTDLPDHILQQKNSGKVVNETFKDFMKQKKFQENLLKQQILSEKQKFNKKSYYANIDTQREQLYQSIVQESKAKVSKYDASLNKINFTEDEEVVIPKHLQGYLGTLASGETPSKKVIDIQIEEQKVDQQNLAKNSSINTFENTSRINDLATTQRTDDFQTTQRTMLSGFSNQKIGLKNVLSQIGREIQDNQSELSFSSQSQIGIQSQTNKFNSSFKQNTILPPMTKSQLGNYQQSDYKFQGNSKSKLSRNSTIEKTLPISALFNQSQTSFNKSQTMHQAAAEAKYALHDSPYQNLQSDLAQTLKKGKKDPAPIRGYLAEKLRRKSVLNCELFKNPDIDYKRNVAVMLKQIDQATGTQYVSNKSGGQNQNMQIIKEEYD